MPYVSAVSKRCEDRDQMGGSRYPLPTRPGEPMLFCDISGPRCDAPALGRTSGTERIPASR